MTEPLMITVIRRRRGLTQCELADLAGINQLLMARIEYEEKIPDDELLEKLATILQVDDPKKLLKVWDDSYSN